MGSSSKAKNISREIFRRKDARVVLLAANYLLFLKIYFVNVENIAIILYQKPICVFWNTYVCTSILLYTYICNKHVHTDV